MQQTHQMSQRNALNSRQWPGQETKTRCQQPHRRIFQTLAHQQKGPQPGLKAALTVTSAKKRCQRARREIVDSGRCDDSDWFRLHASRCAVLLASQMDAAWTELLAFGSLRRG